METRDKDVKRDHTEQTLRSFGSWSIAPWFWRLIVLSLAVVLPAQAESQSQPATESGRFVLGLGGEAVKDQKTGLLWEQAPDSFHGVWSEAPGHCRAKTVGGKQGWRVPTVQELSGLIDRSRHDPALPEGHPFSNIKSAIYWTATPSPTDDIVAWQVSFFSGEPVTDQKSGMRRVWCVLGGIEQPQAR